MTPDELFAALQQAVDGLLFPSESDFPLEPFVWPRQQVVGAETQMPAASLPFTPTQLLAFKKYALNTPVQTVEATDFFEPVTTGFDENDPEQAQSAPRFARLLHLLQTLDRLSVFRVGQGRRRIDVFVVGVSAGNGDFAGVFTTVIET